MRDPKPRKRLRLGTEEYSLLRRQVLWGKRCRLCGDMAMSVHHLVSRGQGGDDVYDNMIPLCGDGTRGCHADVEERRGDARSQLRARLTPDNIAYADERKGRAWLDRHYPELVGRTHLRAVR